MIMTQEQHIWFIDKGFTMNQVMVKLFNLQ